MLLLAGCGDGGGSGSTAEKTEQPAKRKPDPVADRARAERINLTLGDLGPGWTIDTSQEPGDAESGKAFDEAFDKVLSEEGYEADDAKSVDVDSPHFARGERKAVSSSVSVYEEEEDARKAFAALREPDFTTVFSDGFNAGFKAAVAEDPESRGATVSPVTFTPVPFPVLGQEAIAFKGSSTIREPGVTVTLHYHFVSIRHERALAVLDTIQGGRREYPQAEVQDLATKMAQRMAP